MENQPPESILEPPTETEGKVEENVAEPVPEREPETTEQEPPPTVDESSQSEEPTPAEEESSAATPEQEDDEKIDEPEQDDNNSQEEIDGSFQDADKTLDTSSASFTETSINISQINVTQNDDSNDAFNALKETETDALNTKDIEHEEKPDVTMDER